MAECRDCVRCVPQFGIYTGQRTWFLCRASGINVEQERSSGTACGPAGKMFEAYPVHEE